MARARVTGVVYLLYFIAAVASGLLTPGITGPGSLGGDAAAITNNIAAHRSAYEAGVALGLASTALYVALAGLFYSLFRPVSPTLALLAVLFSLMGCAVMAFGTVMQLAPLVVLGGGAHLTGWNVEQVQSLAVLFLRLNGQAGQVALVFFGVFQLFLGYLIFRSTFLPRMLGVLIAVAGVGWLTFLAPVLPTSVVLVIEVLGFVSETALMLWLLLRGVKAQRWNDLRTLAG